MNKTTSDTILVIDDRRSEGWFIEHTLHSEGFMTISAFTGCDGLTKTQEIRPDLIVLDSVLPDIEGHVWYRELQNNPIISDIPILFLIPGNDAFKSLRNTLSEQERQAKRWKRSENKTAASFDFHIKPVEAETILAKVRNLLSSRKWRTLEIDASRIGPILIIDDNRSLVKIAESALVKERFSVVTASGGLEGIRKAKETNPSLILLDIVLPELNGFEILKTLRKFTDIPVIMLTADNQAESVKKTAGLGANDYLLKPFGTKQVIARVRERLGMSPAVPMPVYSGL